MSRARDPFTAAVTTWWSPLMKQHGFRNYSIPRSNVRGLTRRRHRTFARIANGRVFQYFDLAARSSSPGSGARFHARYASLLIGRLQEEVYSTAGGTIDPEGGRTFADWPADTHGQADDSMVRVRDRAAQEAVPWLDATATVEGLAGALAAMPAGENPNTAFELGCCHATLGRVDEAAASLREAITLFQTPNSLRCFGASADRERLRAEELLSAIERGTSEELLARWGRSTIENLGLGDLPGVGADPA